MIFNLGVIKKTRNNHQPKKNLILRVIKQCLLKSYNVINIEIMFVSASLSEELNLKFRGRDNPTNVISIEYRDDREQFNILNGELYICDSVIIKEAASQKKDILSPYIHMIIHGVLHIQGLDHIKDKDALYMESLEVELMSKCGFSNPYIVLE
jgi:probable rRNA maturation factor